MTEAERIEATRVMLEASCREREAWISGDGRVGEEVVAELLGISIGTLRNQRAEGCAPPCYKLSGGGHRVTYRLSELAAWIEARRVE